MTTIMVRRVFWDRRAGNIPWVCGGNLIPAVTAVFSNLTFLKIPSRFPNYFSPHPAVQENAIKAAEKNQSERFRHVHAGVSQPPVCNGRDDTLQEGLSSQHFLSEKWQSLTKTLSFFSTRPTSKTSKLLRLQASPRVPTDRLQTTRRLLNLSPWPRFRTSPGSQSLCRNCPWALCCWSSPSSGRTCWRAAPTGWGSRWPASPCCPGRAST